MAEWLAWKSWMVTGLLLLLLLAPPGIHSNTNIRDPVWLEYMGIGPPLFPAEADKHSTCYLHSQLLVDAKCTTHVSQNLPVTVHHFNVGLGVGVLLLQRTPLPGASNVHDPHGTAIYRLRVIGPDGLHLFEPTYCRPDLATAIYSLPAPGTYSLEILLLYTNFSFRQPNTSQAVASPWAGYLTLHIPPPPATPLNTLPSLTTTPVTPPFTPVDWSPSPDYSILRQPLPPTNPSHTNHLASSSFSPTAHLPLCPDTGPLPGSWHFTTWPNPDAAPLLRTCIWGSADPSADCADPSRRSLHFDSLAAGLVWRPTSCRFRTISGLQHLYTNPHHNVVLTSRRRLASRTTGSVEEDESAPEPEVTPRQCLTPGRHVCFIGDSHMRNLHNSLELWRLGFTKQLNLTAKQVLSSPVSTYVHMRWGHDWPPFANESQLQNALPTNCTDVFVNFGQWPASYRSGSAPFSAVRYLQNLKHVRQRMLALRAEFGTRLFWVTTCISTLKARLESNGTDWRTDPFLLLYNRLAADVMAGTGGGRRLVSMYSKRGVSSATGHDAQFSDIGGDGSWGGDGRRSFGGEDGGPVEEEKASGLLGFLKALGRRRRLHAEKEDGGSGSDGLMSGGKQRQGVAMAAAKTASQSQSSRHREQQQQRRREQHRQPRQQLPSGFTSRHQNQRQRRPQKQSHRQKAGRYAGGGGGGPDADAEERVKAAGGPSRQLASSRETGSSAAIPFVDTWSSSRVLHDVTWDGVHYANTGVVGLMQLTAVLHALCGEDSGVQGGGPAGSGARAVRAPVG